jgi:hypothetical protein
MLWQLKDSDVDASLSLLDTMLAFAHRHARQRNALALLESGLQPLFFTYRRDNNAPLFGPFVLLPDALQRRALDLARYVLETTTATRWCAPPDDHAAAPGADRRRAVCARNAALRCAERVTDQFCLFKFAAVAGRRRRRALEQAAAAGALRRSLKRKKTTKQEH